nr:hypothetical protein [Tanacetum cinerariifolium]
MICETNIMHSLRILLGLLSLDHRTSIFSGACGFPSQVFGRCLVVKPKTIRMVLSLAGSRHCPVHQLDVKNSFLHGNLSLTVYMHQPPGFWDSAHPNYGMDTAYLLFYVDDIVLTASFSDLLHRVISSLHQEFAMIDLGSLNYFLGISVTRDSLGMFLSQKKYAVEILERAGMVNCNPSRTLIDTESKLGTTGGVVSDLTQYRSLAGSLQYLTFTRPDISYVVQQRQPTLSCSSVEAEYQGDADVVAETYNGSAIYLSSNPVQHQRTKHIEIDIHFVQDLVAGSCWSVRVLHVPSRYQYADIFTKGLPIALFEEFRSSLSSVSSRSNCGGVLAIQFVVIHMICSHPYVSYTFNMIDV